MIWEYREKVWAADSQDVCMTARLGACGSLVAVGDISQIVCTARNLNTNTIIGARNGQSVLQVNGGVYADGQFTFTLSTTDTALAGNALTTARETHVFQFVFTLTNGLVGTLSLTVECLARPAVTLNTAADLGWYAQRLRIMMNETNSLVPDSDWIDLTMQDGLVAVNQKLKYSYTDVEVTLVAGTAEYALPANVTSILWGSWNGKEQYSADQDTMRRRAYWWRTQSEGTPERYVLWNQKVIVVNTPNAAAVAADDTLLLRCYTTPPPFRLNGMVQLPTDLQELPLFWAAAQWMGSPMGRKPDVAKFYLDLFQNRLANAVEVYKDRLVI